MIYDFDFGWDWRNRDFGYFEDYYDGPMYVIWIGPLWLFWRR